MSPAEIIAILEAKFPDAVTAKATDVLDPWVAVRPDAIADVATFCRDDQRLAFDMLLCVTGVDYLETDPRKAKKAGFDPHLEVVYHLASISRRHRFVLKVMLPRWKDDQPGEIPEVPTVTGVWAAADWHERETYDLCGVRFIDHPNLVRILCAEDWVGHPLRKDYEFPEEYHGIRAK